MPRRPTLRRSITVLLSALFFATFCSCAQRHPFHPPSASSGATTFPIKSEKTSVNVASKPSTSPSARPTSPFESEIRAFEAADRAAPPPTGGVLFLGSSSFRLWTTLAADFPGLPVINRGFGGSHLSDSLHYADRIALPYRPRTILLYAGDNDIAAGKSPERVLQDFQSFTQKIHATLPDTRILYVSIKASLQRWPLGDKIRRANDLIRSDTQTDPARLAYIDTFTPMLGPDGKPRKDLLVEDGLHLSRKGYELWTQLIRPHLENVPGWP